MTPVDGAVNRVQDLMERLVEEIGVEATVEVQETDEGVSGQFVGEDLGLLIGHRGQTLDAIQHLAYRIAFRGATPASALRLMPPDTVNAAR